MKVRDVVKRFNEDFQRIVVRNMERGELDDPFMMRRVWTIRDQELAEEWLVIRHEYGRRHTWADEYYLITSLKIDPIFVPSP